MISRLSYATLVEDFKKLDGRMPRTSSEVVKGFVREVDPEVELAAATNPVERLFYSQADRRTTKWHHYLAIYDRHLSRFRGTPARLLEIGVRAGGSLQMWRRYLGPSASIHGLDIDARCRSVDDPDLTVHIGSQTDTGLLNQIVLEMGGIDILIDDGSHVWSHQISTFETLYSALSPNGLYICEDVHTSYFPDFNDGHKASESFVNYAKRLIDRLHVWYALDDVQSSDEHFARMTRSVSFYDSMVVIERQDRSPPFHTAVGSRALEP